MHIDIEPAVWRELLATEPHVQVTHDHSTVYWFEDFTLRELHDFNVIQCVHTDITDMNIIDYIHALVV